jgi:adenylate cyclase
MTASPQNASDRRGRGTEIERKFLVAVLPADLERCESSDIRQGYLAIAEDDTEVRVRDRGGRATLTVKRGRGRVRAEEEIELDAEAFAKLWPLTEGRRIEKRRHLIPVGADLTIELDVYSGALAGLATAEVEFPSETAADAFEPPAWLGPELTGDPRFSNQRLAVEGIPD